MCIHHRRWHEFWRLVTGITKHDALVPCSLFCGIFTRCFGRINALSNISGLSCQDIGNKHLIGMEDIVVVGIANLTNRLAHDLFVVKLRIGGNFTG